MNYEEYLDEILDAYEEAFENLPVYKKGSVPKMNDVDSLARTVAFEIVLGGDRIDAEDVKASLDGVSRAEMNLFRDRVKYHAIDFAPAEYRTESFLDSSFDGWTRLVDVKESADLRQAFLDMASRKERGAWFRFEDGDYIQCNQAVLDVMRLGDEKRNLSRKRVSPEEVAKAKAAMLLQKYGEEVNMDGPVLTVDLESYGQVEPGTKLSVRGIVDILENDPLKKSYFVTYSPESGGHSSSVFTSLEPAELDRLIRAMDNEIVFREGRSIMESSEMAVINFPNDIRIEAPVPQREGGGRNFNAERLFYGPDGEVMVAGKYMFSTETVNFPLREFSDKSLSVINAESEKVLRSLTAKAENRKEKQQKTSRGID